MRSLLRRSWRYLAVAIVVAGLYLFVRGLDSQLLLATLGDADPALLVVAAGLAFAFLFFKAVCWRVMLAPRYPVPVLRLFRYTVLATASSLLVPARAGEALRIWLLRKRDAVPATTATGVALAEKLVDGIAMIITVAPALILVPGLPPWVARTLVLLVAAALTCVVLVVVVRRRARPDGLLGQLAASMTVFSSARRFARALVVCLLVWLADLACVMAVFAAVDIDAPIAVGLLVLLGVNVAILLPVTPGNLGALEIGAIAALDLVGVPRAPAVAFAILYHAVQVIPLVAAGLLDLRLALSAAPAPQQSIERR
jgi:uncharacterized membrane protein YbhN (UPF0104 family)